MYRRRIKKKKLEKELSEENETIEVSYLYDGDMEVLLEKKRQQLERLKKKGETRATFQSEDFFDLIKDNLFLIRGKVAKGLWGLFVAANLFFYLQERSKWVNDNYIHHAAKEYVAPAKFVLAYHITINKVFSYPNSFAVQPFVLLQEKILESLTSKLPKGDAERALWRYHFKLSPYTKQFLVPRGDDIQPVINETWYIIHTLATRPMADKRLQTYDRFLVFPLIAFYYEHIFLFGYQNVNGFGHYEQFFKGPKGFQRLEYLVDWFLEFESEYKKYKKVSAYIDTHPMTEAAYLVGLNLTLHDIIFYEIFNQNYRCDNPYVKLYYAHVERYNAKDSVRERLPNRIRSSFDIAINHKGERISYFGTQLCNFQIMPGDYASIAPQPPLSALHSKKWEEQFNLTKQQLKTPKKNNGN